MEPNDVAALDDAVHHLNLGEIDPFLDLMSEDMVWRGYRQPLYWWRQPSH